MDRDINEMYYRWNEDRRRVELWCDDDYWVASMYRSDREGMAASGYPVLSYKDTWCEPTEQTTWGNDR